MNHSITDNIKRFTNLEITRMSLLILVASPIPAAVISLQGTLLSPEIITTLLIFSNLAYMLSPKVNKLPLTVLLVSTPALTAIVALLATSMFLVGSEYVSILIAISVLGLSYNVTGSVQTSKVMDALKNKLNVEFDMANFNAKKLSVTSGVGVAGQLMSMVFYTSVDLDMMALMLTCEALAAVLVVVFGIQRWYLLKEMDII